MAYNSAKTAMVRQCHVGLRIRDRDLSTTISKCIIVRFDVLYLVEKIKRTFTFHLYIYNITV